MKVICGKRALVTGAASGIGREIALALAREGADLYLLDVDEAGLTKVIDEARQAGVEAISARCDLTRREEIAASIQALIDRWGYVDILVNNAGVAYYGPTENMTQQQWDWLMGINLLAPIQIIQKLLPKMLARPEAHILNVCSISGLVAGGRFVAYHASKFGLVGFSEGLRAEYGRRNLGVTALCPGTVMTNLYRSAASGRAGKPVPLPPAWISTTPEKVAEKAIRAIRRNKGLVVITPLAHALYYLKRFAPGLLDAISRIKRKKRKPAAVPTATPSIEPNENRKRPAA